MTSFCRRVIAMRMIVANKKRIASLFLSATQSMLTDLIPRVGDLGLEPSWRGRGEMCLPGRDSHFEMECAKFCKQCLS
jgi:hypothetical protein